MVMPERAFEDMVIVADCQMTKTRENILANKNAFVSFYDNDLNCYIKCDATAKYFKNGELYNQIKNEVGEDEFNVKGIVRITIKSISEYKEN